VGVEAQDDLVPLAHGHLLHEAAAVEPARKQLVVRPPHRPLE
jgi:hypothetical protein